MCECEWCEKNKAEITIEVFHPFDKEGNQIALCEHCSDEMEGIYMCEACCRYIYETNGIRVNIRYDHNDEAMYCVACLQKDWFKRGMKHWKEADWFDYNELIEYGYYKYKSYYIVNSTDELDKDFKRLQLEYKVICNLDSSGMGLEYHVSLWIKPQFELKFQIL